MGDFFDAPYFGYCEAVKGYLKNRVKVRRKTKSLISAPIIYITLYSYGEQPPRTICHKFT